MKYLFLLSGDYIGLAKEEVLSLFDIKNYKIVDKLLIIDLKNNEKISTKSNKRLALTKRIYRFLFECKVNELIKIMENFDWNSIYKDSFRLRLHYLNQNKLNKSSEKDFAKYIWRALKKPRVNLENPKTKIELFFVDDKAYCGLLIKENKEDFESRKAHLRPFPHPSSLHPKLARALVNITGIKDNETLLDPFCGTGGFLIEAGLMNIKIAGCDISKNMVKGSKENLKHFKIKNYEIIDKDALKINKKLGYIVTDLPYGLNSNVYLQYNKNSLKQKSNKINLKINQKNQIKNLEQFYLKFLKNLRKIMKKRAVLIFPNYVNYKKLIKIATLKIEKDFSIYVHRSLTRKIVKIR